jgi:hypothetical protein
MRGHGANNGVQCSDTQCFVIRYRDSLVRRCMGFKNDVAAYLVDFGVIPISAEQTHELVAANGTRKFHRSANISSRTR